MSKYTYLRAYMAGIVVPTIFLLVIMAVFSVARFIYHVPIPIERVIVFPMAMVPNLWGAWNMLYVALRSRPHLPVGFHGAALLFVIAPVGLTLARTLDLQFPTPAFAATVFPIGLVAYYLAWKYLVGFFNELLGIA
ncbi:MAG: hypothetical protein DMG28_04860 [Acidobacteria bacterium]|nr:MAG: hypothetical protein DMG28_04860 [Acidobacteriota bacterium]